MENIIFSNNNRSKNICMKVDDSLLGMQLYDLLYTTPNDYMNSIGLRSDDCLAVYKAALCPGLVLHLDYASYVNKSPCNN